MYAVFLPSPLVSQPSFRQALEWGDEAARVAADTRFLSNMFNTAAQLPLDVLAIIPPSLPSSRDTFAMSQVCRRWRTALISFATLWTRIDCQSLSRTIASLERHRSVPLHLELRKGFSIEVLNMVLDHGSKFASVFARLTQKQLNPLHQHLVTPSVEELVLFFMDEMSHQ